MPRGKACGWKSDFGHLGIKAKKRKKEKRKKKAKKKRVPRSYAVSNSDAVGVNSS